MLNVRLHEKGDGCTKLDKTPIMMDLLCAVLQVKGYGEDKVAILCSVDHYITFV